MPRTKFELMILLEKSKYKKLAKEITSIYVYEDTGQGTNFDATTQVGDS